MTLHSSSQQQPDIVCLSHLRWKFVFQRPQHLMSRFAREGRVFYVEEPVFEDTENKLVQAECPRTGVLVVTPHLNERDRENADSTVQLLLKEFLRTNAIVNPVLWFYTPMALSWVPPSLDAAAVVYDCMDELSMFRGASVNLHAMEQQLLKKADLMFTGGVSLFEAKRDLHRHIYPFPSGVDVTHFRQARTMAASSDALAGGRRTRVGFAGVIDERLDTELLAECARLKPEWDWIMIGPVVKIDPEALPRPENIHWLGMRDYKDLPGFFAEWDVAMMPFALNDSTRFISPTKTPEFLAAGLPVVSTAIRDVVRPYGELGLVRIAHSAAEFVQAVEASLAQKSDSAWIERADRHLMGLSWDSVWSGMNKLLASRLRRDQKNTALPASVDVRERETAHV